MASAIQLNTKLVEEARKIGRHRTRRSAVTAALKEYIKYRKQLAIIEMAGKVDYDPEYDYKAARNNQSTI